MVKKALKIAGEKVSVYILRMADGSFYTGMTNNTIRRFKEHGEGRSKSTKGKLPFKVLYVVELGSRQEARNMEVKIKTRGARLFMMGQLFNEVREENVKLFEWWDWKNKGIRIV